MKRPNTILREKISVYGESLHVELRKERAALGNIVYHMYKVYDFDSPVFEEQIGCCGEIDFDNAFDRFARYCGRHYTEHFKEFIREYDKTRKI